MLGQSIEFRDCPRQTVTYGMYVFSHLPNDRILVQSKLKEFTEDKVNVAEN